MVINLLADEQFAKLTSAKAEKRFDLLTEEHKAHLLEMIPKLIVNFMETGRSNKR